MNEIELHEKIAEVSKTIFSYCMAKTPTREEAEDLSQDILYELIKSAKNIRDDNAVCIPATILMDRQFLSTAWHPLEMPTTYVVLN